jgi:hypothetical protein
MRSTHHNLQSVRQAGDSSNSSNSSSWQVELHARSKVHRRLSTAPCLAKQQLGMCLRNYKACMLRACCSAQDLQKICNYGGGSCSRTMQSGRTLQVCMATSMLLVYLLTLSSTASGSRLKRAAMARMRSGRKVPSVSTYAALPAPPPCAIGSCTATHSVWHSCVLPVLQEREQAEQHTLCETCRLPCMCKPQ